MTAIEPLLHQPAAQAIGWALLQFVWQGALIAAVTALALAILKRSAADVRYVVATIALTLMLTVPVVTAVQSWRAASPPLAPASAISIAGAEAAHAKLELTAASGIATSVGPGQWGVPMVEGAVVSRAAVERWLPMLLLAWLTGVLLLTLRLMSGWLLIQRLKTHGVPAHEPWNDMAARLSRRLHITRGVRLLESSLVDVPTVIGWLRPAILLPASVLAGLAPQQVEVILAHELAHIRRHDYLVNLLQTLVETLLFYHPAVWWLSRRIRVEREDCCDDLAVSLCGDPYTYARALADLEERRGLSGGSPGTALRPAGPLAMAATGGSLLHRVRRLLGAPTSHAGRGPGWLAGAAVVLVMSAMVAGALGGDIMRAQQASAAPVVAAAASRPPSARQTNISPEGSASEPIQPSAATPAAEPGPAIAATAADSAAVAASAAMVIAAEAAVPSQDASATVAVAAVAQPAAIAAATSVPAEGSRHAAASTAAVLRASQESSGNFTWSHNGEKLEVSYRGEVEFTDDDTDVKRLSPGGYLKIRDGGWLAGRAVEFRADAAGNIERRFSVGMSQRPFEPEGRQWLAQALPRFIRQTGIGAQARVARILKASGPSGVLAEISRIEGSWAKRVYFRELLRQASLDAGTARQALLQIAREIDSDFERASLLVESGDQLLVDDASRKAYFEAARGIRSDFEARRVYTAALKRGPVSAPVLAGVLDASRSIDSDFELASLLVQVAKLQPLDQTTRAPFFAALATIDSDFEHRRVLSALAERRDLTPETVAALLDSAIGLQSDFELASLLTQVVKAYGVEGSLRAPFFRAVDSIDSAFERGRVLKELAKRSDVSPETVVAILRAVQGVKSSHEASQVLLTVAGGHTLSGPARDLYIDAAERLGDFEQGRVLAALVRNERRR